MKWNEFTATLTEHDHRRLVIALGATLQETRKASEIATGNGDAEAAREHIFTALQHLLDVASIVGPAPRT